MAVNGSVSVAIATSVAAAPIAMAGTIAVRPFSCSRFRKVQSRVWTNRKLVGGP